MSYSLYVHVPFCAKKCDYCDFVSFRPHRDDFIRYVNAVLREADTWRGGEVETLYLGGGTPSLLPPPVMERLMAGLAARFDFPEGEHSIEANPESVTAEKLACWKGWGINRLSMGLQAVQPRFSEVLGRKCDRDAFERAYCLARDAGFDNINADLLTGLPGQKQYDLTGSLDFLFSLGVEHISLYELTLQEDTPLGKKVMQGLLRQPPEEEDRQMFRAACQRLRESGYERYEISNFAKPGRESRHNLVYWRRKPYLGLGPAAASMMGNKRWTNADHLEQYLADPQSGRQEENLTDMDAAFETFMLGLRLTEGIRWRDFKDLYRFDLKEKLSERFSVWEKAGLAAMDEQRIALTDAGMDVQNPLLVECMPAFGL